MRRVAASGLIGLGILLCTARPASAQWSIIKWLEELSGPGHIVLQQFDVTFGCNWRDQRTDRGWPHLYCDQDPTPRLDASSYKGQPKWESVRGYFIVAFTAPWFTGTGTNPLEYPDDTKRDHVRVKGITGGFAYRVSRVTDVAIVSGFMNFSGSTAKSFDKWIIDPYVLIRPLATISNHWGQAIELRLDAALFPQGFTLEDFGAIGGSLDGRAEWMTSIGIRINPVAIFRGR